MRCTQAKFVTLGATSSTANNAGGEDGDGGDLPTVSVPAGYQVMSTAPRTQKSFQ